MALCDAWYAVTANAGGSDLVQCVKPMDHGELVEGRHYSQTEANRKKSHLWVSRDGSDRARWPESETHSHFEPKPRMHR